MKVAKVMQCGVTKCAYNKDSKCHTVAITVGGSEHPWCDTLCVSPVKGGDPQTIANVGACKASDCKHNEKLECAAPSITVAPCEKEADCAAFEKREGCCR